MRIKQIFLSIIGIMSVQSVCAADSLPISVKWEMGENGVKPNYYSTRFVIKNVSDKMLDNNWEFYYNHFSRKTEQPADALMTVKEITPNYFRLVPNEKYKPLAPGDSVVVDILLRGQFLAHAYGPDGGHFAYSSSLDKPIPVKIDIPVMNNPLQWSVKGHEYPNYPDGNFVYAENNIINPSKGYKGNVYDIFPTPKSVEIKKGVTRLLGKVALNSAKGLDVAVKYLTEKLLANGMATDSKANVKIELVEIKNAAHNSEYYEMSVNSGKIKIAGNSQTGVLNGVKTLISVIEQSGAVPFEIPNVVIKDYPDLAHRGMMLDIARNFTTYDNIKKFIDNLAAYKINVFHFHFSDDEAWRLEIPGIPELITVGSRKGLTHDEKDFLIQTYAGNGNPNDNTTSANGYITKAQFIEMIRYAASRGIEVIPEIETPGHARAAIVSMKSRYDKYKGYDMNEANRYRVWDMKDTSVYTSSQGYHDNILNIAEPGTFRFLEKVIDEIVKMYDESGVKLKTIHIGGDEVPRGSWDGSPAIQALLKEKGLKNAHEASEYYLDRISEYIASKGVKTGGWQEVATNHGEKYNNTVAKRFSGVTVWSTMGHNDSIPYSLANAGYPVVLSNVNNFYFDMMYSRHQYENGLNWGGWCSEFTSWDVLPYNMYRSARHDVSYNPTNLVTVADGKPALKNRKNIIGVQGQLWAETVRNYGMVESYVFPKILGLVERGWNCEPVWETDYTDMTRYNEAKAQYNLKIGTKELLRLQRKGSNFHIGQPGIVVENGLLKANTQYPGVVVRYTLDGSEPNEQSPVWTSPVACGDAKLVKARAYYLGKESVTTYLFR